MPRPQTRNTERIAISILPADLVELDALAARLSEPGLEPNRSAAVRHVLRSYLASEDDTGRRSADRTPPRRTKG